MVCALTKLWDGAKLGAIGFIGWYFWFLGRGRGSMVSKSWSEDDFAFCCRLLSELQWLMWCSYAQGVSQVDYRCI